jgi:hypothetical protein
VEKENIPKTTNYGNYEFNILPFGFTKSPTSFMSLMNSYYLGKFVLVFSYDILIYSEFKEEHMENLKAKFEILKSINYLLKKANTILVLSKYTTLDMYFQTREW